MKGSISHWWAVLLDAELQSEMECSRHHDGKAALRNLRVAARARTTLRDKYGLNLDTISEHARERYHLLYAEEVQRDKDAEENSRKLDALLEEAKAALQKPDGSG